MAITSIITMTETPEAYMKRAVVAPLARFNEAQIGRPEPSRASESGRWMARRGGRARLREGGAGRWGRAPNVPPSRRLGALASPAGSGIPGRERGDWGVGANGHGRP